MVDDSDFLSASQPPLPSGLRRRNSICTGAIPAKLTLPPKLAHYSFPRPNGVGVLSSTSSSSPRSSFPAVDFELISLKSLAYTSLKDLLPSTSSAVQSPTGAGTASGSCYEIPIRNHLVKQAAWAYLQPMSASPGSSGGRFFDRLLPGFSAECIRNRICTCLGFINRRIMPAIIRAFDRILRFIRVR